MDGIDLLPLVEELGDNIDDLETALGPILQSSLSETASKLPLLEKAKLQVLVTYAIESILFSVLKLNDVDARQHPVFNELTRVKQYFEKIREVEEGGPKKRENLRLDKPAAGRLIKHVLAGNSTSRKASTHIKFDQMTEDVGSHQRFKNLSKKREVDDTVTAQNAQQDTVALPSPKSKKQRPNDDIASPLPAASINTSEAEPPSSGKRSKKEKKHSHKHKSSKPPKSGSAVFQDLLNKPPSKTHVT